MKVPFDSAHRFTGRNEKNEKKKKKTATSIVLLFLHNSYDMWGHSIPNVSSLEIWICNPDNGLKCHYYNIISRWHAEKQFILTILFTMMMMMMDLLDWCYEP